jgi:phage terminase small subunit
MPRPLTPYSQAFVAAYLTNGRNGTAAHRAAYPGAASTQVHASAASRLLKDPRIKAVVAEADREDAAALAAAVRSAAISKQRIAEELAKIAFADPRQCFSLGPDGTPVPDWSRIGEGQAAGIVEVTVDDLKLQHGSKIREARRIRIKFSDKRLTLMSLAHLLGYLPEHRLHEPPDDPSQLTDAELEAAIGDAGSDRCD